MPVYSDIPLEEAIISCLLRNPDAAPKVALLLEPEDFEAPSLRALYSTIVRMVERGQAVEEYAVARRYAASTGTPLKFSDALHQVVTVLAGPSATTYNPAEVERYAGFLARERAAERKDRRVASLGQALTSNPASLADVASELEHLHTNGKRPQLRTLTHADLAEAAKRDVTTRYLCGPILRRGDRTMVLGPTGQGKTTLTWRLVAAALNGTEFLQPEWRGSPSCNRVLAIDVEQNEEDIAAQLSECGLLHDERVTIVSEPDGLELGSDERQRREIDAMLGDLKPDILVLDPVYKLHRLENVNDERQVTDLMRILDGWRSRFKVAIVIPMHTRKLSGEDTGRKVITTDDASGAAAFTRGSEIIVGLRMVQHGYSLLWHLKDRRSKLPVLDKWGLIYDAERGFWRDTGGNAPEQSVKERVRIALVQAELPQTLEELEGVVGHSERAIRKALEELSAWPVGKEGRRMLWSLPEKDKQEYIDPDPDAPENVF